MRSFISQCIIFQNHQAPKICPLPRHCVISGKSLRGKHSLPGKVFGKATMLPHCPLGSHCSVSTHCLESPGQTAMLSHAARWEVIARQALTTGKVLGKATMLPHDALADTWKVLSKAVMLPHGALVDASVFLYLGSSQSHMTPLWKGEG